MLFTCLEYHLYLEINQSHSLKSTLWDQNTNLNSFLIFIQFRYPNTKVDINNKLGSVYLFCLDFGMLMKFSCLTLCSQIDRLSQLNEIIHVMRSRGCQELYETYTVQKFSRVIRDPLILTPPSLNCKSFSLFDPFSDVTFVFNTFAS